MGGGVGQKQLKSISPEPLMAGTWLTPHFNWKTHFSNSVSYKVCPAEVVQNLMFCFLVRKITEF